MSEYKRAFQVPTTANSNAVYTQATEAKEWLNGVLEQIARATMQGQNMNGRTVTVIIEVLL